MNIESVQKRIIMLLLGILPYHYFLFSVLFKRIGFLTIYRDLLIVVLLVLSVIKYTFGSKKISLKQNYMPIIVLVIFGVFIFKSQNLVQALTISRVYFGPIVLLMCTMALNFTEKEMGIIRKINLTNAIVICIYGVFQAYCLGADYLIKLGYGKGDSDELGASLYLSNSSGSILGRSIQRVISTFSAANMCAFYLCCILIFLYFYNEDRFFPICSNNKKKIIQLVIISITILLTFSRSCWLGLGVAYLFHLYKRKKLSFKTIKYVLLIIALFVVAMVVARDNPLVKGISHIILSSFSGSDTSIMSHAESIESALVTINDNPFGVGLGKSGPRAVEYGDINLVESSYLLMCFEIGIVGSILYFFIFLRIFIKNQAKNYGQCILILFALICFINIPYIQEYECMAVFAILIGCMNSNKKGRRKGNEIYCILPSAISCDS